MAFEDLRAFAAVARLRSMSKAAAALETTQSTVSKRVQRLEQMLHLQLIDRQTRPIGLTVEGRSFQRYVNTFLEAIDSLTQNAREQRHVRVAVAPILISHGLVPIVGAFRAAHPDYQLSIITGGTPATEHQLRDGSVDLWLAVTGAGGAAPQPGDVEFEPLFASDRVLIVPKGHPLATRRITSLAELADYPLITRGPDTPTRLLLEREFERTGVDYHVALEVDDMDAVKRYVAYGLGISVVLQNMIEPEDLMTLAVVPLAKFLPPLQMSLGTLRGRPLSEPARRFVALLRERLRPAG